MAEPIWRDEVYNMTLAAGRLSPQRVEVHDHGENGAGTVAARQSLVGATLAAKGVGRATRPAAARQTPAELRQVSETLGAKEGT